MDILTHLTLGACIGEAFAGRKLGKHAMLWGAISHSLPDADVVTSMWLSTPGALLAHRGLTHSFLFCALFAPIMAIAARSIHSASGISWLKWTLFFGLTILLHDGLDSLNSYGVGWFEPFSRLRISFNTIYIADPWLTIWPLSASLALLCLRKNHSGRRIWLNAGLGMCCVYLLYCGVNKIKIDRAVHKLLTEQKIAYTRYFTTPAPLQNWLWYIAAGNDSGYYVGYRSLFDHRKQQRFHYFPRSTFLLGKQKNRDDVSKLIRFSQEFYTIGWLKDSLVFNDLRFEQQIGWQNPDAPFVFHYFLLSPEKNRFVVQRGRFSGWNGQAIKSLWSCIKGNQ